MFSFRMGDRISLYRTIIRGHDGHEREERGEGVLVEDEVM